MRLSQLLVQHASAPALDDDAATAIDTTLAAAITEAHRRWPAVVLAAETYVAWVAARVAPDGPGLAQAVAALRLPDLYLACACAGGDPKALVAFDAAYLGGGASDDLKQRLRQKLFVHAADATPPRIALYAGRGELASWVRAAITRMTIDEQRATREVPTEDALMDAIGIDPGHSPELAHVKADARDTLQAAFREAVATLTDRERTLLLQYHVDGVGLAALGKLFGLAPSNISRTLAKARAQLVSQIKRALMRRKKIAGDELDSLVDLVRSQLSLTAGLRGD